MNYGEYDTNFGRQLTVRQLEERMARQYFGGRQGSRRRRESRTYRFGASEFDWNSDWQNKIPTISDYYGNMSSIWYRLNPEQKKKKWVNELALRDTYRELNIIPDSNGKYEYDDSAGLWEPTYLYFYNDHLRKAGLT